MSIYSSNRYSKETSNNAWFKVFQFVPPNARVLDLGCSSGHLGQALKKEKHVTVIGVDIDEDDLKIAQKHLDETHLLNVETDDLSPLGSFDVVIMADVIEHLVDPVSALKKIRKQLKPGGRLVFSIPNMANITTRLELLTGRFEYKDFGLLDRTHLHFYDEQEVNRVLVSAGFDVKETDCTIRNIPEDILKKDLADIGIELTPKLLEHLQRTKSSIYQFIGYAETSDKPKRFAPKTASPLDSVSREIEGIIKKMQGEISDRDTQLEQAATREAALNLAYANKSKELAETQQELEDILQSKGWRLLSKGYKAKAKLKSRRKS